ncbi:YfjI family protein [Neobacillus sp. NRS-1170]|uniref:YfjI family protein n=1 Tax=Neobacillus sp. NRS-1170 TaxID=3233898 RepID=UPI003D2DC328
MKDLANVEILHKHGLIPEIYSPSIVNSTETNEEWGEIEDFAEYETVAFPTDIFPSILRNFIEAVSEDIQVPRDILALLVFSVLSTTNVGKFIIQLRKGWLEPINTYIITAMDPGSRKSEGFKRMIKPIKKHEKNSMIKQKNAFDNNQSDRRVLHGRIVELEKYASKEKDIEKAKAIQKEIYELNEELNAMPYVSQGRIIADDVTPEQLVTIMQNNDETMSMLTPEGGLIATLLGRYSEKPNFDIYLKGYDGESVIIDRRGRSERLEEPLLTIGATIQPGALKDFDEYSHSRGLPQRFLYSIPKSNVGYRRIVTEPVSEKCECAYEAFIDKLLSLEQKKEVLLFDIEAQKGFDALCQDCEELMRDGSDFGYGHAKEWMSKLPGKIGRLIALLHISEHCHLNSIPLIINSDTVYKGTLLLEYFKIHYLATFGMLKSGSNNEEKRVWHHIKKRAILSNGHVERREVGRAVNYSIKADEFNLILLKLQKRNFIKFYKIKRKEMILVNPIFWKHTDITDTSINP